MSVRSELVSISRPFLERNPAIKDKVKKIDLQASRLQHRIANVAPMVIRPRPRQLTIAITAYCNLRCNGCR